MLVTRWLPRALVLMAVLSLADGTASAKERLGKKTGAALHRLAKGADRLEVVRVSAPLCTEPRIRVSDANEIEELLRLLDGLRDADLIHGCAGHPVTRLYRRKKLVAEFSVDHGTIIRPFGALTSFGDSPMPMQMAKQVAAWYARHGLAAYQIEVEQESSTDDGVGRAIAILPPMPPKTQKLLSSRYRDEDEDFSELVEVFTKEVPDTKRQASLLLRSLAQLSTPQQHRRLSFPLDRLARAIPREAILSVLNRTAADSDELLGAWLLEDNIEPLLAGPSGPLPLVRDRFAQRIAREPVNEWALAFVGGMVPARDLSSPTQDYLFQAVSRWAQQVCFSDSIYSRFRDRWVRSAVEGRLPPWLARALQEAAWSCPIDEAEARVILRIARGELPNPQDLLCATGWTLEGVREFVHRRGTAEDISFALAHLITDGRGFREVMEWLGPLSGLSKQRVDAELRSAKGERFLVRHLQTWWKAARATYRPPVPAAPSDP